MSISAQELWDKAWIEELGDKDLTNARVAGRVSKANPNKEDVQAWQKQGPKWTADYIAWRQANPNWKIWVTPQGAPAIELGLKIVVAGVPVQMYLDRVFEVDGQLVIMDLKTSQSIPKNPLQLGFYKMGIEQVFDREVLWGNYFMARTSGTSPLVDLSFYTRSKMEYLIETFDKARKTGLFLPNADSCGLCGFTKQCQFSSKREGAVSE